MTKLREATGPYGADAAIEAVGVESAVATALAITAPAGGSYSGTVTVTWNDNSANGEYGVWLNSGSTWYYSQLVAANGATADSAVVSLASIPVGTYEAVIAYRQNLGVGPFVAWATSPGSFTVTP